MSTNFETQSPATITLTDANTIGVEGFLEAEKEHMSFMRYHRMKQGVRAARFLTRITVLNETPRLIGTYNDKYMVFPFFKPRTMQVMNDEQRNEMYEMHKNGNHDKHRNDVGRTRLGRVLARKSLDELFMINRVIGTTTSFGLVRAPLTAEAESQQFADAAQEHGMTAHQAVEAMTGNVGEFTTAGYFGSRIQNRLGRWLWMYALGTLRKPTRLEILASHLHPRFRQQTGNNEDAAIRSEQYAQMVYAQHLPELETTPVIKLEPLPIIVD